MGRKDDVLVDLVGQDKDIELLRQQRDHFQLGPGENPAAWV
jgi:hypothetical protein